VKYKIAHWYGKQPPVPDAVLVKPAEGNHAAEYEVEVEDIHDFVEIHGPIACDLAGTYGSPTIPASFPINNWTMPKGMVSSSHECREKVTM
jgi:hypothetical protein